MTDTILNLSINTIICELFRSISRTFLYQNERNGNFLNLRILRNY
eukprot:UN03524